MENKTIVTEKIITKKRITIFIVLTYVISWFVFSLIPLCGLTYGEGIATTLILAAAMFIPALTSILTRLITKEGFKKMYLYPHFKGHVKDYLLVFFGPTFLLLVSGVVYFLIFPAIFDSELMVLKKIAVASRMDSSFASTLLLISIVQIIVLGPIVNLIPTLGEEIGWRGYLLPKLRELFSDRIALIITGIVWGVWHAPIIALGHNYGKDYIGYPWTGIMAMIVFCVVLGIIEGYVSIKMESVIPAAMIHSTVNAGAALPILLAKTGYNTLFGPAITGMVGGLPFVIVAAILLVKVGKLRVKRGIS